MAGMEQIEIHSKSYLLRWVNAKHGHTISWTIQPHKRSINFGLFKHPGQLASFAHFPSVHGLPPLSLQIEQNDEPKDESEPAVVDKLTSIGMKQVIRLGKCEADRYTQGVYEVPAGEGGNYALVFDNTFSKTTSKTVTIFLLTYPTSCTTQIQFGAQVHHSQAMASAMSMAPPLTSRKSPKLKARNKESSETLVATPVQVPQSQPSPLPEVQQPENTALPDESSIHTGILQKRRRKKHQGYARRFFCLDFTSSTLSYYHDRNSSALRGAIPLSLAAIGANAKTREISIDSGAEIWHLKANNQNDFVEWKKALEAASRKVAEATTPGDALNLATGFFPPPQPTTIEDQEWARLEGLLSKIAGTRDSIRRLCLDTLSRPLPPISPGLSPSGTPTEAGEEGYFSRVDEKRPFWKRKTSTPNLTNTNAFKRSISSQLAVPIPGASDSMLSSGATPYLTPTGTRQHCRQEEGMHDHMKALLHDLDKVVQEFSSIVNESKQRRIPPPSSAISRLSLQSLESQEYFDAEDRSNLLDILDDSDRESKSDAEADSEASSEVDDDASYHGTRGARSGSLSSLIPPRPKSFAPLPLERIRRRDTIQASTVTPPSLIGFLRKNVGKDLSTISMPVSANEPLSLLQRAAEQLEYSDLLDTAAKVTDTNERMMYVTAFVVSQLSNARIKERSIRKPFNPMLGETFELVREDKDFRFVAEKVSHRPVQLAYHAESPEWAYISSPLPSQKFWGKSSEIITEGKTRLILRAAGERYSWSSPTCFLRNIIAGEKYVEPVGSMTIHNETNGMKAVVNFKAKGMFSGRSEEVDVQLLDEGGSDLSVGLSGTWTQSLFSKENGKGSGSHPIWTAGSLVPKPEKHYGMTTFAAALNEVTTIEKGKLPSTDSRLRPDQRALEDGDADAAEELKNKLEEAQRARRREMEADGTEWKPRWFTRVENGDEIVWKLKTGPSGYWEQRAKDEWTDVVDVLKVD